MCLYNVKKIIHLLLLCILISSCKKGIIAANKLKANDVSAVDTVTVINQGIPGNTAENLLSRINTVIKQAPNLVIIMVGTNDVIQGNNTYNSFNGTLSVIIDSLKHTGSSVMLLTPPPIESWNAVTRDTARIKGICTMINNLSVGKSCYYVDVNAVFRGVLTSANCHQYYFTDGVHPTAIGDKDMATAIFNYMSTKKITAGKIVCFGDSITYGAYLKGQGTSSGDTYPAVLQAYLNTPD